MARREAINEVRPVLEDLDKVADVVDKGLDAVEKGVDVGVEAIDKGVHVAVEEAHTAVGFVRNPKTAAIILLVVNVAGAGFVGWKLAKRHYTKKFDAELAEQVEEARRYYTRLHKDSDELTPEALAEKYKDDEADAAEAAADALSEYQGAPAAGPIVRPDRTSPRKAYNKPVEVAAEAAVEPEVPIEQNVFVNGSPLNTSDFDLEEELRKRDPEVPYVVTQAEYLEEDSGLPQTTLTYYAGDDILTDDRDNPIDNVEDIVGQDNLARFGHGSGDKNIVYIRNERVGAEYEIAYSAGKFSEEVHGFIEHSDRPVNRRFRQGRDE
jgi:hypothetical protein